MSNMPNKRTTFNVVMTMLCITTFILYCVQTMSPTVLWKYAREQQLDRFIDFIVDPISSNITVSHNSIVSTNSTVSANSAVSAMSTVSTNSTVPIQLPVESDVIVCYPSPYVDCSGCSSGCTIRNIYSIKYDEQHKLRISTDKESLGVTEHRLQKHVPRNKNATSVDNIALNETMKEKSARIFKVMFKFQEGRHFKTDFSNCKYSNCVHFKGDEADADVVLKMVEHISSANVPKSRGKLYGLVGRETPIYFRVNKAWNHFFNFTTTYRRDADIFDPYGKLKFVHRPNLNVKDIAYSKTKTAVWVVSNCRDSTSKRMKYVQEMQKYIDVDIYGGCGKKCPANIKRTLTYRGTECVGDVFENYKFYLAFENSFCKDYFTEKFFKTFRDNSTVISVARGGADYDSFLPPKTFINAAHFKGPKSLALYLKRLGENLDEYSDLLKSKLQYTFSEDFSFQCDLCKYLNTRDESVTKVYSLTDWLGQCKAPTDI